MQHDLFHVYTVDQHIMMVVRNMRRFTMTEHAHEYPFCSQLIANFRAAGCCTWPRCSTTSPRAAAATIPSSASRTCWNSAATTASRSADTELVVFLVEQHLTMSQVAQKQDLSDPDVIAAFAGLVKDERHLTALYLLTVADIRGTSPKVWNAWKAKLLEDLYKMTLRVLGGEPHSADRELRARQQEALATLRLFGLGPHAHERCGSSSTSPTSCATTPPTSPGRPARCTTSWDSDKPVVKCAPGADRRRPAGDGLREGPAGPVRAHLQLFRPQEFQHPRRQDPHHAGRLRARHLPGHRRELRQELPRHHQPDRARAVRSADPPGAAQPALRGPPVAPVAHLPDQPTVDLRPDERGQFYLLSVAANDRTGLLYSIASVLTATASTCTPPRS
jgi:[protein-PII] uridylyltransferase